MNDTGSKQTHYWEKPWSTDELRKHSNNWTLAGDSGLLNGLENLSQKILARTEDVQKEVDSLVQESKATGSRIYNAINDFLMLSNTQFVENRVYDEEIQDELANTDKKNHTEKLSKEEREAELVPRIREAVQLGLNVIETAFEKHHVSDSESDEEHEDHTLPILKPKDYYIDRPLPYIIGSEKFMQDDCAGLGELYSDEEEIDDSDKEEVNKENDLTSDSEESEREDEPKMNHIQTFDEKKKTDSEDGGGDLFAPSDDEFGYEGEDDDGDASSSKSESQTLNNAADFAAELAAKLGATQRNVIDEDYVADTTTPDLAKSKRKDSKVSKTKRDRRSSKLSARGSEVSGQVSDDDFSPFGQTTKRFSSSGGGLFDDFGEEENDLFSEIHSNKSKEANVRKDSKVSVSKTTKKSSVSLFDDDNNDLFVTPKMETGDDSGVAPSSTRSTGTKTSLFNETDDDDDLFGSASLPKKKTTVDTSSSLFDETDNASDDLSSGISESRVERSSNESTPRTKPPPGVFSMFGVATASISEAIKAHRAMSDSDKESEGDRLSSKSERRSSSKLSSPKLEIENKVEVKSEKKIIEKEETKEKPKNDLFGGSEKAAKVVPRKISLFDDDDNDDEDLFAAPAVTSRSQEKVETKPKLDEVKPKVDEVKPKLDEVESQTQIEITPPPKAKKDMSLFDDDDEDADSIDIFKTSTQKQKEKSSSSGKLRTHSLFDEEDALFGGPTEEAPSVDLFKAPDAGTTKNKSPVSLFDETDDGLFASKTNDSKGRPPIPTPRRTSLPREETSNTVITSSGKRLIGGVSLTGGLDPFANKNKRSSESDDSPKKEAIPTSEKSPEVSRKSSALLSMDVIQQPNEIQAVNFDEPPEARTLHVVSKERAKIQTKRRLPTRKARKAATHCDVFGDETDRAVNKNSQPVEKESVNVEKEPEKELTNDAVCSPSTEEEDLLPVDELIGTKLTPPTLPKEKESVKSVSNLDSDLFGDLNSGVDDLFATRTKKPSVPIDDIFSSASKAKTKTNILISDDDDDLDDLFATPKNTAKKDTTQKVESKRESTPKVETKKETTPKVDSKKGTKSKSLFDTESDSDDIFADLGTKKQTKSSTSTPTTQSHKPTKSLFDDDDDDDDDNIFNDPLMVKSSK